MIKLHNKHRLETCNHSYIDVNTICEEAKTKTDNGV